MAHVGTRSDVAVQVIKGGAQVMPIVVVVVALETTSESVQETLPPFEVGKKRRLWQPARAGCPIFQHLVGLVAPLALTPTDIVGAACSRQLNPNYSPAAQGVISGW